MELRSNRLKVEIAAPGVFPNTTLRFDRAAFISQVTLDDKHTFCTAEDKVLNHQYCTGGVGICSEIKADTVFDSPVGGKFHKFGVGLFTKPDEEGYSFRKTYECEPYEVKFEKRGENTAVFEIAAPLCEGYALNEKKTVTVEDNRLVIDYEFENTGEKPLALGEYCHNFINIDDRPLGPEYYLKMAVVNQDGKRPKFGTGAVVGKGSGFTYESFFDKGTSIDVAADELLDEPFYWELTHSGTTAVIREEDSFKPSRIIVWSVDRNISPEIYNTFELAPGEKQSYQRRFVFSA